MRWLVLASMWSLKGCNSLVGTDGFTLENCFGHLVEICLPAPPADMAVTLGQTSGPSGQELDTDRDNRCLQVTQPNGPPMCAIVGTTITIQRDFYPYGSRPFVLIATDSITIVNNASLDLSSVAFAQGPVANGAGSNFDGCPAGSALDGVAATATQHGGGGGAGGTFTTAGGNGGAAQTGEAGGVASTMLVTSFDAIRGGCPSGLASKGGNPSSQTPRAARSGGAAYLVANRLIQIDGGIAAGGAGGFAGGDGGGGSGGGTGGMIALDAPMIVGSGVLASNGGGGGGGGDGGSGGNGGENGHSTDYLGAARGGNGTASERGGRGGDGSTRDKPPMAGAIPSLSGGGGGGGGGMGVIWVHGSFAISRASPTPTED